MGEQSWRLVNNELMVRVSYMNVHQILHIFATFTHLYSFPTRSKCVGKAWLGGAAVWLQEATSVLCTWLGELHWHSKNRHIFAITTDLFAFPMVLSAISGSGRSKMWGRFGWLELLSCWRQQRCHLENSRIWTPDGCDARPVMATSMMAALAVETQSTMGGGEGERMGVVQALR